MHIYVVVNFLPQISFSFVLGYGTVAIKVETKKK